MSSQEEKQPVTCIDSIKSGNALSYYQDIAQKRALADLSELSPEQQHKIIVNKVATTHDLPINPSSDELLEQLKWSKDNKKPLIIKLGIDPTGHEIHIGHMVPLMMADRFLRMGHHFILIVGNFTAKIGDGSGREKARTALSDEQIEANLQTYKEQASKVIDVNKIEYRFNGDWLSKITSSQLIALLQKVSASQMWQREDFQKRLKLEEPISMAELLYPVFMAMDSVELVPDIELGGLDQYINLLWCREIMRIHGQKPESFVTVDLIPGTDGSIDSEGRIVKMSKSLSNYIGANTTPEDMFGKVMSIPDNVMWIWLRELTELYEDEIADLKARTELDADHPDFVHPKDLKRMLASLILGRFNAWDDDLIQKAEKFFDESTSSSSSKNGLPEGAEVKNVVIAGDFDHASVSLLGKDFGISGSQTRRLISQGAVKVLVGEEFESTSADIEKFIKNIEEKLKSENEVILRVGKRNYVRVGSK